MEKFFVLLGFLMIIFNNVSGSEAISNSRTRRNAVKHEDRRWPGGVVPYKFSQEFSMMEREEIVNDMNEIENISCVTFKKHDSEPDYLEIVREGCTSHVGHIGGRQELNLGPDCINTVQILQLLMYILGLNHEHNRPDRDDYIEVLLDNVEPGAEDQFFMESPNDVDTLGLPYDPKSILHYYDTVFSIDGIRKTFIPRQPGMILGEGLELSELDKQKINKLYRC